MTLAELITATRAIIGDKIRYAVDGITPLLGPQHWTDTEITTGVNWACQRYCEETQCTLKEAVVSCTAGIARLTDGVMAIHSVAGLDSTTLEFEDLRDPAWRSASGTPARWMRWGDSAVRTVPAGATATVVYIGSPSVLVIGTPTGTPDSAIPVGHHAYLPMAAASYLFLQFGDKNDGPRAGVLMVGFQEMIGHPRTPGGGGN